VGRVILQAPNTHVPKKIREARRTKVTVTSEYIRVDIPDAEDAYFASGHRVIVILNHGLHQKIPIPSRQVFRIIWGRNESRHKIDNHSFCRSCKQNSAVVQNFTEGLSRYHMKFVCLRCGTTWTKKRKKKKKK